MASSEKELEVVLLEVGNRLLSAPSAADELLPLLDQAETLLSRVEQSPSRSMSAALRPAMEALACKELLEHADVDVRVSVASTISEITRITAPEAPYDDDVMKVIFHIIVDSFGKLDDMQNRSFAKRVSILETVAKVRSCVVMLDLECDTLILEMFHHFLRTIRDSHPGNVFSSMEIIMTIVLEESEVISTDILSCLLTYVKKDNKVASEISKRLTEKVICNCSSKLKHCLGEAIQSLGSKFDDYSEIVASVCKKGFGQLLHSGLNVSGGCLADDSKLSMRNIPIEPLKGSGEVTSSVPCSEEVAIEVENENSPSTKCMVSNGAMTAQNCACSAESVLLKDNIDGHLSNNMTNAGVVRDEVDTTLDHRNGGAQLKKCNFQVQPPENAGSSQIHSVEKTVESLATSKESSRNIDSMESETADKVSKAVTLEAYQTHTLQMVSEKSPNDNKSVVTPAQGVKFSETGRPKRGRPPGSKNPVKKDRVNADIPVSPSGKEKLIINEHTVIEETPVRTFSKKRKKGISDLANEESRNANNAGNQAMGCKSDLDSNAIGDSEGKPSRSPDNKPKISEGRDDITSIKELSSISKQRKGRTSSENNVAEHSVMEEVYPSKTNTKADNHETHVAETPEKRTPRKDAREKKATERYDESLVGAKIKVWWPDDRQYYPGVVGSFDPVSMQHKVLYVDGDEENLVLKDETFLFLKGDEEDEDEDDSTPLIASETSHKKAKLTNSSSRKEMVVAQSKGTRYSAAKSISGRSGSGSKSANKTDDNLPIESTSKVKAGNKSSSGFLRSGSASKGVLGKKPVDAPSKSATKSKHETLKAGTGIKDEGGKSNSKSEDAAAAKASSKSNKGEQTPKRISTAKSEKSDASGSTQGKVGSSKGHETVVTAAAQDGGNKSGKKRKR